MDTPTGIGVGALAVPVVIPELTDVLAATGKGSGALAMLLAIPELAHVLGSIGEGIGALAINTVATNTLLPPALGGDQKQNKTPPERAKTAT